MKSQVVFHLEQALSHLKAAEAKQGYRVQENYNPEGELANWLRCRGSQLEESDWSDQEAEGRLCLTLADYYDERYQSYRDPARKGNNPELETLATEE